MNRNREQDMASRVGPIACVVALAFLLGAMAVGEARAGAGFTERVSVDPAGNQVDGDSRWPSISANGRYVAFQSDADALVAGDTNGIFDVFVRDRQTRQTTRVSLDSAGNQGDNTSINPSISADGRYVAFSSEATNLVAGDSNGVGDIFIHDRLTGETTRVSVDSAGNQGDNTSINSSISADGRYVAFASLATNLVADDTNAFSDIFVHDRQTGQTTRVSVDSDGIEGNNGNLFPSISADGRYVAFESLASNLVEGDTNGSNDIFVRDRDAGQTTRVSVDSAGTQGGDQDSTEPSISADGRYVAFASQDNNLVAGDNNEVGDIFVHDRLTGQTTRVSVDSAGNQANDGSGLSAITADGRYVAFNSDASNLVAGDNNAVVDAFVHDRQTGQTTRVSLDSAGNQGNGDSFHTSISTDGRTVAFITESTNLVPGDTNGLDDIIVHQLRSALSDFDGDGKTDIAVWRPSSGFWYIHRSSDEFIVSQQWGASSDNTVSGDYDGDGKTDIAVWRPSSGIWYILRSGDGATDARQWGAAGDITVPGDYDGDGKTDIAVWRPSIGFWYIQRSSDSVIVSEPWGAESLGDIPVPGDYDGDAKTDIAVFRPSTGFWYILRSLDGAVVSSQWGGSGDTPVPGDYDGDAKTDIAVYRPNGGNWFIQRSSVGVFDFNVYPGNQSPTQWGVPGDIPAPGDYDGGGNTDIAVWRPTGGIWYIVRSSDGGTTTQQWGEGSDIPLKSLY